MKLTADNIKFIDSYLTNSGIKYIDIRMEMTDHIATALEGMDGMFYDNFKKYMAANKSQFLSTNRKFANAAIGTALRSIGKEMLGPWFLVPLLLMFGVFYFTGPMDEEFTLWAQLVNTACFCLFIAYYVGVKGSKRNLFSVTDKVMLTGWLVIYIGYSVLTYRRLADNYKLAGYAVLIAFTVGVLRAFYKVIKKYKVQYNG